MLEVIEQIKPVEQELDIARRRVKGDGKISGRPLRVLVVDVGGTNVKLLAAGWSYDVISLGFPGAVLRGRPAAEPKNLSDGWVGFDFEKAFGCPVKVINDAAMQALGSYEGGRMLFLGLAPVWAQR